MLGDREGGSAKGEDKEVRNCGMLGTAKDNIEATDRAMSVSWGSQLKARVGSDDGQDIVAGSSSEL